MKSKEKGLKSKHTLFRRSGIGCGLTLVALKWRPDTVVQVGIGGYHHEMDVMWEEWPDCKFHGCEPNRNICKDIALGVMAYPGTVYNVAVGEEPGVALFYPKRHHIDGSSMFPVEGTSDKTSYEVRVETLDGLFGDLPANKTLLWLDCEGSELKALRGGEKFMRRVDAINVEMSSKLGHPDQATPVETHRWLADHGFWLQWLHTHRVPDQIDAVYVSTSLFNPGQCCVPHEIIRFQEARERA